MSKVTGVVQAISERTGGAGAKKWTNLSFCIDDTWYGGFISRNDAAAADLQRSVKEGDTVTLTVEQNGKYLNWTDVQVDKAGAVAESPTGGPEINLREYKITLGGTLKVAAEMAGDLLSAGLVSFQGDAEAVRAQYIAYVYGLAKELADRAVEETPGNDK